MKPKIFVTPKTEYIARIGQNKSWIWSKFGNEKKTFIRLKKIPWIRKLYFTYLKKVYELKEMFPNLRKWTRKEKRKKKKGKWKQVKLKKNRTNKTKRIDWEDAQEEEQKK